MSTSIMGQRSTELTESACELCGERPFYPEYDRLAGVKVCGRCAEAVANAYNMAHSGRWLTWPNSSQSRIGKRKSLIPHSIRRAVYERDKYRCVSCDTHLDLTLDHIHPESKGGETSEANLRTLCRPCNSRKGTRD